MNKQLQVLIVENDTDFATTAMLVGFWGHGVRTVANANEGLVEVEKACPDVVVVDVGLPGMDGWVFTERLREMTGPAKPIVIVVSGHAGADAATVARSRRQSALGKAGFS